MKVLLKVDVDNLGYAGEVMEVADGYGRNFLIPRGLAVKASAGALRQAQTWRERAETRMAELRKEHEALSGRITGTLLNFTARAGETGKLYGSVTTADIVDKLNETLGTDIERRSIGGQPLRQLGEHMVTIRLSRDYAPQLRVVIHPFEEEEETEESEIDDEASEEVTIKSTEETAATDEGAGTEETTDPQLSATSDDLAGGGEAEAE